MAYNTSHDAPSLNTCGFKYVTASAEDVYGDDTANFPGATSVTYSPWPNEWGVVGWYFAGLMGTGYSIGVQGAWELVTSVAPPTGNSTANFYDDPTTENTLAFRPTYTEMTSGTGRSARAEGFTEVNAYVSAVSGTTVSFYDDPANDETFTSYPTYCEMTGAGYYYRVEGSVPVNVYATGNPNDTCNFYDSSGADTFTASPGLASMSGPGYGTRVAHGFAKVFGYGSYVYGQTGQGDTAEFYDGPGDDTWIACGHWNYGEMSDGTWNGSAFNNYTYLIHTQGFDIQKGYATAGGTDVARLKDTPGHDVFCATGGVDQATGNLILITTLTAPQMSWETSGFEYVYAVKTAGGSQLDEAHFTHDPSGDYKAVFNARSYQGYMIDVGMSGPGFFALASDFNKYYGYGLLSTNDEACFRTTGGGDTAQVWPTYAELTGTVPGTGKPVYLYASGFKKYFILRDAGDTSTNNVATLHGTSGNDTFTTRYDATTGYPYCEMTLDGGVYYKVGYWTGQTRGFDKVYVDGQGGNDTANLYGSAADDTFWAHLGDAVLSDGTLDLNNGDRLTAGTYYYKLMGFGSGDIVNVYGSTGTNQRKVINPIDYALAFTDTWVDL